jgi:hypothetical protein
VKSCARLISWDLIGFCVRLCDFRSVYFDLRLSSLTMIAALVRWSFGALARQFLVCLLQKTLPRQALPGSGDAGARMAARLRLVLVSIVIARWSKDLFVIFISFGAMCNAVDDY